MTFEPAGGGGKERDGPASPVRLYRLLLRLLPRDFRHEFGSDMEQLFRDRLGEARGHRGALGLVLAGAADVLWQASREWTARGLRGLTTTIKETMTMNGWMKDVSFGIRTLLRRPGFTLAAIVTLALGIGATVSIFTVVNGVLLRPLPYPDSEDLFEVRGFHTERGDTTGIDHPDVRFWQEQVEGVQVAGYTDTRPTLTGMGYPEVVSGVQVTNGLMDVLGVSPALGRDVRRDEDVPGGPRVVVVSHRFWSERLGRDPDALGRTITLDGEPWEIVGVAPEGFDFPNAAEIWLPRHHEPQGCGHGCRVLRAIGRLDPGTSLETAQTRFERAAERLADAFPDAHRHDSHELRRLIDVEVADVRAGLWILLGAVTMVLLIACANVANLLLARGGSRKTEVALRATLGASRARIVRQLLTESLILAVVGGLIGLGLALWGTSLLLNLAPADLPRLDQIGVDGTAVGFTVLVVFAVTAVFGLLPARELSATSLSEGMGSGRGTSGSRRAGLFRSLLLAGEVALSLALLLGAGLMLRTLAEVRSVELGFRTEGVERFRISLPESRYDSLAVTGFFEELEQQLAALPEVESAGTGFGIPLASGSIATSFRLLDRPEPEPSERDAIPVRLGTPGYLDATGLALERGRWFELGDRRDARPVAVVNRAAADRYFPDSNPIGTQIRLDVTWGFGDDPARTIVGVVGDVRTRSPTQAPEPAVYLPNAQFGANSQYVVLHLAPGVETAMDAVRQVLGRLDPNLAVTNVHRLEAVVDAELAPTRFYLTLLGIFSVLAIVLASVGLYGVVAFLVTRRTKEIGIRIALGARSDEIVGMIVRQGVRPAVVGIIAGLLVSLLGVRVLRSLLFGVSPYDPMTLIAVTVILGLVVVAATVIPAARASHVAPAIALREE